MTEFKYKKYLPSIGVVGLILGIIYFVFNWLQTDRGNTFKEKDTFETRSITYKPELTIDSVDTKIQCDFTNPLSSKAKFPEKTYLEKDTLTLEFGMSVKVNRFIRIKNNSKNDAKLLAIIRGDSISGQLFLREILFHSIDTQKVKLEKTFLSKSFIKAGSTYDITYSDTVRYIDSAFSLHLIVLYSNYMGNIYDNYYIHRYRNITFEPPAEFLKSGYPFLRVIYPNLPWMDTLCDFKIYNQEEIKELKNFGLKLE